MFEVKIVGTGNYVPGNIVKNDDIAKLVNTSDSWITDRTGIRQRRISKGDNTSDIAAKAAKIALDNSHLKAEDIDLIVVATTTQDCFLPSVACIVQNKIKAVNATCFDISAACTGFIYALNVATQFIKTGQSKNALVIGAEILSKIMDWKDRNTCVLFGDGAGAVVLENSDKEGIIAQYTGSDGSGAESLQCSAIPVRNPYCDFEDTFSNTVSMNGREIFKFGVKIIPHCIDKVLESAKYTLKDIDYIIPHQANKRIIELAAKKLNIDENKFYVNLDKYGNTSGASIPIALHEMNEKGLLNKGDKIILVGFGGGLTYGAQLIIWN